jgi:hypothetical protein
MTYPAHEGDGKISRIHDVALSREIAERLGADLDHKPVRMSPYLMMLMTRLRDQPPPSECHL